MKLSPWYLAALTPFAVLGSGAVAHAVVLAVTLGIFFGTLSLGRTPAPETREAIQKLAAPDQSAAVR